MQNISKLTNINFKHLGNWLLEKETIFHTIKDINKNNFLYAFVVDDEIMYIGKSTQTIAKRFSGYKKPGPSQKTNIKNNKNIKDTLSNGKDIEIYIFIDDGVLKYGEFNINLSAALEDDLISQLNPQWNH